MPWLLNGLKLGLIIAMKRMDQKALGVQSGWRGQLVKGESDPKLIE